MWNLNIIKYWTGRSLCSLYEFQTFVLHFIKCLCNIREDYRTDFFSSRVFSIVIRCICSIVVCLFLNPNWWDGISSLFCIIGIRLFRSNLLKIVDIVGNRDIGTNKWYQGIRINVYIRSDLTDFNDIEVCWRGKVHKYL